MVEINRVWLNVDTDTNKITLFSRPRVSIRVDEYIWSLIEEHIVKPHNVISNGTGRSLSNKIPALFSFQRGFRLCRTISCETRRCRRWSS